MSSRSIGMKHEREFEKNRQEAGYLTYRVKGSTRFNKEVDMFGLFDIMTLDAIYVNFYQVKTNSTAGAPKAIKEWKNKNKDVLPPNCLFWVVIRYTKGKDKGSWRYIRI